MMSCYCVIVVMFIVVMLYFLSLHYLYQPALVFCQLSNNSLRAYYLLLEAAIIMMVGLWLPTRRWGPCSTSLIKDSSKGLANANCIVGSMTGESGRQVQVGRCALLLSTAGIHVNINRCKD